MNGQSFTKQQLRCLQRNAEEQYESLRGAAVYRNVDFVLYVLLVMIAAFGLRVFVLEPIRVDGNSMVPTLLDGEHMFVEKVGYWFEQPARGDVIICFYPGYTESCVKRVIGLPGDTVEVRAGRVRINGAPLDESAYFTDTMLGDFGPETVKEKHVFVMGDNRNGSKDSRNPSVGAIPLYKVEGRVRAVIWPVKVWRRMPHVEYPQ